MRVTVLQPGSPTDVELDEGLTVAALRSRLTALTGDARWRTGTLTADGEALHDDHPAGRAPLHHGATVRPGPGPVPDAVAAARADRHLAVVAGADAGALLVPDGPACLGPGGDLPVDDGGRWLVAVRPGRRALLVRGAAGRVRLGRPGARRSRAVRRWCWTRWHDDEELRAGPTTVVARSGAGRGAAVQGAAAPAHRVRRRLWRRLGRLLPAVAGAATSAALAATMHQPVLLLGALSALLMVGPRPVEAPPAPASDEPPDAPGDLARLRVALARGDAPGPVASPLPWDGDLALAGPREPTLRLARALLLAALATRPEAVVVRTDRPADWSWLAWFAGASDATAGATAASTAGPDDGSRLVVLDGPAAAGWHAGTRVLRVVGDVAPPWCGCVVEVGPPGAVLRDSHGTRSVPVSGVSARVAEAVARAAGRPRPAQPADASTLDLAGCPAHVALGRLPGVPEPDPRAVARAWAVAAGERRPRLPVPLGAGPGGVPVVVDLVADGPHALVAGTTGSGKSELLATLVLGLALTQPPDRLAVVLVDFKGGTGLPPSLAALPHVTAHLSDLDAAGARRTVRGLFAELRRRERVLAAHGATDLRDLDPADPATPPRLLVVVDEFRALADDLPDLLPGLARLAAQGRSLGMHLVLATQRPTGAVPADLRANVGLRVALRVADAADSVDLVGVGDAARIARPGLAVLVRAAAGAEPVQVARAVPGSARPVRLAPAWDATPGWSPPAGTEPAAASAATWVDAARSAGGDRVATSAPWLPPLPDEVLASDVPAGPGLPLALADLPDDLARGPVRWDPGTGHLLVTGGPGSGRSTTLAAVARAALAAGRTVHCIGVPASLLADHPRLASRLLADDVSRVARLVRLLAHPHGSFAPASRPVLVLDDAPGILAALAAVAHGAPADLLADLWSSAGGPVAVAAAGAADAGTARLAPCFADRLVLGSPDPSGDALQGVPPHLAGPRPQPGRAIHLARGTAALCQVALPADDPGPVGWTRHRARGLPTDGAHALSVPAGVRPLPARATRPRHDDVPPGTVTLGLGGDDAAPVPLDLDRPLLVAGPPGSGRTHALEVLARAAARAGRPVAHVGSAPLPDDPEVLLVVDDLDDLEARAPTLTEALSARLAGAAPPRLLAATTTAHAASAYHGLVPALARARRLLVLDPAEPGSLDLLGPEGAWLVDPRRRAPGRGVLRLGRELVPVQVWAPEPLGR